MLQAFDLIPTNIDQQSKTLNTFANWKNEKIIIGTTDGNLILYQNTQKDDEIKPSFRFITQVKIGKKPVEKLVILNQDHLFVLCDSKLKHYSTNSLDEIDVIQKNGVKNFCVDLKKRDRRFCICLSKRMKLFNFRNGEYKVFKELLMPEPPIAIEWYGNSIFVGYQRGYRLISVSAGDVKEMFALSRAKPHIIFLSDSKEFLLVDDKVGVVVTLRGEPSRGSVAWSDTPIRADYLTPFVIGILPKEITIHSWYDQRLLQSLSLLQVQSITISDPFAFIATRTEIFALLKIPIETQVDQLIEKHQYTKALELYEKSAPKDNQTSLQDHKKKLLLIHLKVGYMLVKDLLFDEAFEHFYKGNLDPRELISLFPQHLLKKSEYKPTNPFTGHDVPVFIESIILSNIPHEKDLKAVNRFEPTLKRYLEQFTTKTVIFIEKEREKYQKIYEENKVDENIIQINQDENNNNDFDDDNDNNNNNQNNKEKEERENQIKLKNQLKSEAKSILIEIDTALTKFYSTLDPMKFSQFVESENFCDLTDLKDFFLDRKMYSELANVYKGKKNYRTALEIWANLGSQKFKQEGQNGINETVSCLIELSDPNLIWAFSRWVLEKSPNIGIKIFTSEKRETPLKANDVLDYLAQFKDDEMKFRYLEFTIFTEKNTDKKLHNQLAMHFVEILLAIVPRDDGKQPKGKNRPVPGTEYGVLGSTRKKLILLLQTSNYYDPEILFEKIKGSSLFEEETILLEKMGRYRDGLNILIHKMGNRGDAEKYCEDPNPKNHQEKLLELVCLSLYPPDNSAPLIDDAIAIINKHSCELNPANVLKKLPDDLPLSEISSFLSISIRELAHQKRHSQIFKNLKKNESLLSDWKLKNLEKQKLKIIPKTKCDKCKEKLGASVVARFPTGHVVHYGCLKDFNPQKQKK
ncbi:cnh domain containing [Anaeramoeba ignava]|uniref:Cnh domain containing n=1 Tax=Anaeramoeba ignava TaxID=1746090 RepID=A0A9Q0LGZ8_ANAIG|nr:cnh domain containing [Anaeramoeba ignava]